MTPRKYFAGIALLCATIIVSAGLVAQDTTAQEMSPEQAALMDAWNKYMTPGAPHERLAQRVGEWDVQCRTWEYPGAETQEFQGKSRIKSVMGGRYILEKFEGEFMGMPFEGMSIAGYDNLTKSYVSIWIDNMGTGIMRSQGTPDGTTVRFTTEHPDFIKGNYTKATIIDETVSGDQYVLTFQTPMPDGQLHKSMELTYTRTKS